MAREICTSSELQSICLQSLKRCEGFEHVSEILIQPRVSFEGGSNWTLAAVRPRVDNNVLRAARSTIEMLQTSYALTEEDSAPRPIRRRA